MLKNKIHSSIFILLGVLSIFIEYDVTLFIFTLVLGIPLFFSKRNWAMGTEIVAINPGGENATILKREDERFMVNFLNRRGYGHIKNISYYGKEVNFMNCFLAVNDKQLGVCLRMLYADKIRGHVETVQNSKGKIEFHIGVDVDEQIFEQLDERYRILIS